MAKKPSLEAFRKIVQAKAGNLTKVADSLNMSRTALYKMKEKYPKYQEVLDDEADKLLDFTNDQLVLLAKGIPKIDQDDNGDKKHTGWIEKPDIGALIWLEKTRGKKRGLTDKLDITSGGEKIEATPQLVMVSAATMTQAEIEAYKKQFLNASATNNN